MNDDWSIGKLDVRLGSGQSHHLEITPMGELIAFRFPKKSKRANPSAERGVVVLFTGVRRERMMDPGAPHRDPKRPSGSKRNKSEAFPLHDAR